MLPLFEKYRKPIEHCHLSSEYRNFKKEGKKRSTDSSIFFCRLEEKHYRSPGEIQSEPGYPLTTVAHPRSRESNNKRDYSDPTEIYGLAEPVEPGNHLRQIIISTRILPPRSFSKFSFFFRDPRPPFSTFHRELHRLFFDLFDLSRELFKLFLFHNLSFFIYLFIYF